MPCARARRSAPTISSSGRMCPNIRSTSPERPPVLAEEALDGLGVEALVRTEGAERVEDVSGQHAAEVHEQAFHRRAISRAFAASIGTPRSNSPRYSSSELPDWKRL